MDRSAYLTAPTPNAWATAAWRFGRQVARALLHGGCGPVDPFGQQIDQTFRPARTAGQLLAVRTEDEPERDVDGLVFVAQVAGESRDREDEPQVQGLLGSDDVHDPGGADAAGAVAHAGQVGRRVAVSAVGLAHDQRKRLTVAVLEPLGEHAEGPVVLHQQALLVELGDDDGQQRIVEALPHDVLGGQEDAEQLVDLAGMAHGLGDEDAPEVQRLFVAGLQQHDAVAATLGEVEVAVELPSGRRVELVEIPHAERLGVGGPVHVEQVLDEHAERRAPVTDVVLAPHVVTEERQHAGQGVPDERAAEVADVHLLGHVGRRVVDDHRSRDGRPGRRPAARRPTVPPLARPRSSPTASG